MELLEHELDMLGTKIAPLLQTLLINVTSESWGDFDKLASAAIRAASRFAR